MLIRIGKASHLKENAVTPRTLFEGRRRFIAAAAAGGIGAIAGSVLPLGRAFAAEREKIPGVQDSPYTLGSLGEDVELTGYDAVTHYNNFYEFGTGKSDPSTYATDFQTRPWTVEVGGECMKPGTFDVDVLMKRHALEERIYRLRCVEAWSMVVPWVGFPLAALLKQVEPTSRARFVAFETLYDPDQMPGQKRSVLPWPYVEGLRMDEAMNDLTLLSVGLYGEVLPNQNGAPIRLVVPWKYGFKSIKSIVKITLVENQPPCTWNEAAPREYGFYSNVNPNVPHPRWSQAKERVIGEGLFAPKRDTEMFNGYGEQVAALYEGMDLEKYY